MNTYLWLFHREAWENRAIWVLPAAVSALLLIICLFGKIPIDEIPRHLTAEQITAVTPMLFIGISALMLALMSVYTSWYLLDCLSADRKDRSVLFWKSLPVTDTDTVLSKLFMGLFIIPFVYFIAADVTAVGAAFILSVRGGSPFAAALWNPTTWLQLQALSLYMILTAALWFLPLSGWMLLMSAWANRAVTLWALLAPLVVCYVETKLLGTSYLIDALKQHLLSFPGVAFREPKLFTSQLSDGGNISVPRMSWEQFDPMFFFGNVEMWAGVVLGAAFIAAAIYLRRRYTEV